jgi:hypothetical protein
MPLAPNDRINAIIIARSIDKGFLMEEVPKARGEHATHRFPSLDGTTMADVHNLLANYQDIYHIEVSKVPLPTYVFVAVAKDINPVDDYLHSTCIWMNRPDFFDLWKHSLGASLSNHDVVALSLLTLHMSVTPECVSPDVWVLEGGCIFAEV